MNRTIKLNCFKFIIWQHFLFCLFIIVLTPSGSATAKDEVAFHKCFLEHAPTSQNAGFLAYFEVRKSCAAILSHDITEETAATITDIRITPERLDFTNNSSNSITKICFNLKERTTSKFLASACLDTIDWQINALWMVDSIRILMEASIINKLTISPGKSGWVDLKYIEGLKNNFNNMVIEVSKIEGF
jgi:hypothetical protein